MEKSENICVLVADDVEINAEIIRFILSSGEMSAEIAQNGQLALEMFAGSCEGYYSAILMDVSMPVMDGLEASKEIRKLPRPDALTVPIIAMTSNASEEDVRLSTEAGMNAHLLKPVDPQELLSTLSDLIKPSR